MLHAASPQSCMPVPQCPLSSFGSAPAAGKTRVAALLMSLKNGDAGTAVFDQAAAGDVLASILRLIYRSGKIYLTTLGEMKQFKD